MKAIITREELKARVCKMRDLSSEEFDKKWKIVDCDCGEEVCNGFRLADIDEEENTICVRMEVKE
jgi:hypothetical protein